MKYKLHKINVRSVVKAHIKISTVPFFVFMLFYSFLLKGILPLLSDLKMQLLFALLMSLLFIISSTMVLLLMVLCYNKFCGKDGIELQIEKVL